MKRILFCVMALSFAAGVFQEQPVDKGVQTYVKTVSQKSIKRILTKLVSFGTRHTYSDTRSDKRGIGAARRWIKSEFSRISKTGKGDFLVDFDTYKQKGRGGSATAKNVFMIKRGETYPNEAIVIGGHYDSLNLRDRSSFDVIAPGANDDGSGTTAVIEAARVLSKGTFDYTIIFVAFSGEEEGLFGSRHFVKFLKASGFEIRAMFNNDVIGTSKSKAGVSEDSSCRLFSQGPQASSSRRLARYAKWVAQRYVPDFDLKLQNRLDRPGRGGDHSSFSRAGKPAIRQIEAVENLDNQHSPTDSLEKINFDYLTRMVRVNVSLLATAASAPPVPEPPTVKGAGQDVQINWEAIKGADRYVLAVRKKNGLQTEQIINVKKTRVRLAHLDEGDYAVSLSAVKGRALPSPFSKEVPVHIQGKR